MTQQQPARALGRTGIEFDADDELPRELANHASTESMRESGGASVHVVGGWYQAMFVKCRSAPRIEAGLTEVLDAEGFDPQARRLHLGNASVSRRGFVMVLPTIPDFFLASDETGRLRLGRLAVVLRTPIYDVEVRDGVAVTLIEADPLGRIRVSGHPLLVDASASETEIAKQASERVSFGLLPAPRAVHERLTELVEDGRFGALELAEYLGGLAGFPGWVHSPDALDSEDIAFLRPRSR